MFRLARFLLLPFGIDALSCSCSPSINQPCTEAQDPRESRLVIVCLRVVAWGLDAGLLSRESAEAGRLNAKREVVASVIDMLCRRLSGLHMRGRALHMRCCVHRLMGPCGGDLRWVK